MKKTISVLAMILAASAAVAETTTTSAPSLPLSASVEFDVSKNSTTDKYVGKTTLGIELTSTGPTFGGFEIKSVDGTLSLGDWQIGSQVNASTVSLGKQGDLFPSAGLEVVGNDTLANPTVNESVITKIGNLSLMAGFDDLTSDIGNLDNIQLSYGVDLGSFVTTAAVDYNTDTEEKAYALSSTTTLSTLELGGVATYASETLAYEATLAQGATSLFANGDENDALQNVGIGVKGKLSGLDLYAEASYNIDNEDLTPALGVSYKF